MSIVDKRTDVEAIIRNLRPSKNTIYSGYRPAFKLGDELTSGEIRFKYVQSIDFDQEAIAEIRFIMPEYYPATLSVGQTIPFQEGGTIVGCATILKIHNRILG